MSNLDHLTRRMADLQDEQLASLRETGHASSALGEYLLHRSAERRRTRRVAAVSVALVLVAAGTLVGLRHRALRDGATVAMVRAQAGQRVEAALLDVSMAFDDGSRVVLSSGTSLRTAMVGSSSATLDLERGRANVHVVHTKDTHWTVRAGDYSVAVIGTRFRVDWQPETAAFSVVVEEGRVHVSGGVLAEAVDIAAGQSLALQNGLPVPGEGTRGIVPPALVPAQPSTAEQPSPAVRESAPAAPAEAGLPVVGHRSGFRHASPSSWREQAEAGRYRDALAEAERRGFDGICRTASGADLLTLAEAARYAGRSERAEQALKAVRARFARGEDAAMAAYLLGRMAAEVRRDHGEAAQWFRTYLVERPSGRLGREAEGRLLESLAFMDRYTAREAARAYLGRYPTGPHAAFARNLLGL
jgi:transmembrane sensor